MPNVYDFDETVIYPDSGREFIRFCQRRHFLRTLPWMLPLGFQALRFAWNRKRGLPVRGDFYRFLRSLPDWREEVRLFWEANADAFLKPWFLAQLRPGDIVISCSPEFLLRPLCERLGLRLAATRVNLDSGKYRLDGNSCHGSEKVRRLREAFGEVEIDEFYSDSLDDAPLAKLAKRAWLVTGDERVPWPK